MVYGPIHQGYWFDPSRSLVVGGRPSAAQRSLLEDSYSLVRAAMEMARPVFSRPCMEATLPGKKPNP